jgi:hypothetical protein
MNWLLPLFLLIIVALLVIAIWRLRDRVEVVREFFEFLRERKLWWMMPMIVVFILAGLFVLVLAKSGIATMLYALH